MSKAPRETKWRKLLDRLRRADQAAGSNAQLAGLAHHVRAADRAGLGKGVGLLPLGRRARSTF